MRCSAVDTPSRLNVKSWPKEKRIHPQRSVIVWGALSTLLEIGAARHGLPLQTRARLLTRTHIAGDAARRARSDHHVPVSPNNLSLRLAFPARRRPRCVSEIALRAPPDTSE